MECQLLPFRINVVYVYIPICVWVNGLLYYSHTVCRVKYTVIIIDMIMLLVYRVKCTYIHYTRYLFFISHKLTELLL